MKVYAVEWGDAESCTGEASVDRIFSTYELAKQYIDDINKYENSSWKFFNIMEYSLDEIYVPHLHECINCKKQTFITDEECCDDSDLRWIEDAQNHYKLLKDKEKVTEYVHRYAKNDLSEQDVTSLIFNIVKEYRNSNEIHLLVCIKEVLNDNDCDIFHYGEFSKFWDKLNDKIWESIEKT